MVEEPCEPLATTRRMPTTKPRCKNGGGVVLRGQQPHDACKSTRGLRKFIMEDELAMNTGRKPLLKSIYIYES